jgi:hypothetical protein
MWIRAVFILSTHTRLDHTKSGSRSIFASSRLVMVQQIPMGQSTSAEEVGRNLHHHISLVVKHVVKMY